MRRSGREPWFLTIATMVAGLSVVEAQGAPEDAPETRVIVDRVLGDWHRRSSAISSLEVRFRRTDQSRAWGEKTFDGRLVLARPDLALLEVTPIDENGKPTEARERLVWTSEQFLQFDYSGRSVTVFPIHADRRGLPDPLRLPFLFGMSLDEAKDGYDWRVLRQDQDVILMSARTRRRPGRDHSAFDRCFLWLDSKTYLPKKMIVYHRGQDDRVLFEVVETKSNLPVDVEELKAPCLDAWTIQEAGGWITRLFLR